ncbi:MAG TPA: nuclear transport factor 2 family protein [Candidatus Polarisedimenticolia bacterium]|nr:nuclear transport factor 2 family protein [Candidatus Polarisedimenticolia bacterium]
MKTDTAVHQTAAQHAEDRLFAALSEGDRESLREILHDDCILVDVLSGSEVPRPELLELIGSRRLVFDSIERLGDQTRMYGSTAIVNGQTRMVGRFDGTAFRVHSRYTHVYVTDRGELRLVNAQGTPIVPADPRA